MILIKQHRIFRKDIQANPQIIYIFGDNLERKGNGGQAAEMRGERNSFGIATKRKPEHGTKECYFHDSDYFMVRKIIDEEFDRLENRIIECGYKAIVAPLDGIGTGLAKLPEHAPKILEYINIRLEGIARR